MSALQRPLRALLREPVDARRVAAVWQRVQARRDRSVVAPRRRFAAARHRPRALTVPLLAFAACAAVLALLLRVAPWSAPVADDRPGRVPAARTTMRFADGAQLAAIEALPAQAARVVRLSDGTRIALERGARLVPRTASAALTALRLERGRARFEVAPQGTRRFEVSAGSLRVTVVGTRFTVAIEGGETRVAVEHGRVRVQSPAGEVVLGAGQSSAWQETAAQQTAAKPEALAPLVPEPEPEPDAVTPVQATRVEPDAAALLQLSDRARSARRPAEAARALERMLQRYPRDSQAPLAALTLARLQLDDLQRPAAAARTLQRALALGLPRALQEDALAQLVRAHHAAGDAQAAARAAERYASSYPNGRFAAEVRRWASAH